MSREQSNQAEDRAGRAALGRSTRSDSICSSGGTTCQTRVPSGANTQSCRCSRTRLPTNPTKINFQSFLSRSAFSAARRSSCSNAHAASTRHSQSSSDEGTRIKKRMRRCVPRFTPERHNSMQFTSKPARRCRRLCFGSRWQQTTPPLPVVSFRRGGPRTPSPVSQSERARLPESLNSERRVLTDTMIHIS